MAPAGRRRATPYIPVIPPEEADGRLKEVYGDVAGRRGVVANVLRIHSLRPETMRTHLDFYLSLLYGKSGLSRAEREVIGVVVSQSNGCRYCVEHHADALSRYQKDEGIVAALMDGGDAAGLTQRESAIVAFAKSLTRDPTSHSAKDVDAMRAAGLDDEEILTATLIVGYFNFVNRVVTGLGVELEANVKDAYKY